MDSTRGASVVAGIGLEKAIKPSSRPNSARPFLRPSRYVHEAACALGEDALRSERKALGGNVSPETVAQLRTLQHNASPSTCPTCGDCASSVCGAPSAVDLWQRAFHAEAMECVHAIQAVADANKLSTFATRFDDWRKIDLKSTAQVQQHVKELTRLNQSVEHFLNDCGSLSSLTSFKDSFLALNHCVDELSAAKKEFADCIDAIAEQTAERVLVSWRQQFEDAARTSREQWTAEQQRWVKLDSRLDELQSSMNELGDAFRKSNSTNMATFQSHTSDILIGRGGMKESMHSLDQRMAAWETATNQELVQCRNTAADMTAEAQKLEEASSALQKKLANAELAWQDTEAKLNGQVMKLESDLSLAQDGVRLAEAGSLITNMLRLKKIDSRGVVQLNRQTGQVKMVAPIEFATVKAGAATNAKLTNPSLLQNAAQDIVELSNVFNGPLTVEAHLKSGRGGTPAFWDEVATKQAELVVNELQRNGVPEDKLLAKGLAGAKQNLVLVKLDRDLFPNIVEPAAASPRGRR